MSFDQLLTSLKNLELDILELELDISTSRVEMKQKEKERNQVLEQLLMTSRFEELYKESEKENFDVKLLYPFKEDDLGNYLRKSSEEYKDDVNAYLEEITNAYKENRIDKDTFNLLNKEAKKLANIQLEKIEKEEEEKEEEIDLNQEYKTIMKNIEDTKKGLIYNQIGEDTYTSLTYKYKNMQEIERRELLSKTHLGLCKEMNISCNLEFTKYDYSNSDCVNKKGYAIKKNDINNIPYPLDTIILEQTIKLYIREIMNDSRYSVIQKESLSDMLFEHLDNQKQITLANIKKREMEHIS